MYNCNFCSKQQTGHFKISVFFIVKLIDNYEFQNLLQLTNLSKTIRLNFMLISLLNRFMV